LANDDSPGAVHERNDWSDEIAEIRRRQALAAEMGGADRVARQKRAANSPCVNASRRCSMRAPSGNGAAGGEGVTTATGISRFPGIELPRRRGLIEGRTVAVSADDFTIRGGSSETYHHEKNVQAELMAAEYACPGALLDGTGGGGSVPRSRNRRDLRAVRAGFDQVVANLGRVRWSRSGSARWRLGAARLVASHYSIMVRGLSQMSLRTAGRRSRRREGDGRQLGGADLHAGTGSVDDVVESEGRCLRARTPLPFVPAGSCSTRPRIACDDPADRAEACSTGAIPRDRRWPYEIRPILEAVLDRGSFFEIGRAWASRS